MKVIRSTLLALSVVVLAAPAIAAEGDLNVFVLNLANNQQISISDYTINTEYDSITFKSIGSGLTATVPVERITSIEKATLPAGTAVTAENIKLETVFHNEKSVAAVIDDGGIPANFYVVTGGGGGRSAARPGGIAGRPGAQTAGAGRKPMAGQAADNRGALGKTGFGASTRSPTRGSAYNRGNSSFSTGGESGAAGANAFMDIFR